ncbi:MAG: hypothetical protein AVDCRST_MAG79-2123 [uncultured Thermoleophilia bacterium]|uniref:Amidohydrolase-related domain-containing protein n=1 Tax=uncultured Thermoleophilia bacterium TaxID=1497501 RepID=A0A6J4U8R9_9ACTN|nr:MAG: hypothetical protein AVDCRST_MAG79-2123 [uncultured Thermoleophilia bacterium]
MIPGATVIDVDVHNHPASVEDLVPYLDDHWREYLAKTAFAGPPDSAYPPAAPNTGAAPAEVLGDRTRLEEAALGSGDAERAVLSCTYAVESIHNPYAAQAMAAAANDWQAREWLAGDGGGRLGASIVVASQDPDLAAEEIDRVAGTPGFVQVLLPLRSAVPYGNRRFRPIFAAAARHGLVVALHYGGSPGNPPTASGWPSYYAEQYAGMAAIAQTQLTSLIAEGLFDLLPTLRVTVAEAGFCWVPQWLWRADKDWQMLGREIPWVRSPPHEYVRRHVRFSLRPIDGPTDPQALARVVEETEPIHLGSLLMYASDFPHAHGDDEDLRFLDLVSPATRDRILHDTAAAWYPFSERS